MPTNALAFSPTYFLPAVIEHGLGLLVGAEDSFIEIRRAKHNTYKAGKVKDIRNKVKQSLVSKYRV